MKATGFLLVLAPLVLCTGTAARHEDSEGGFCGVESVETETLLNLQSVINGCFGDSFGGAVPNINFCYADGRINCPAIKKVLKIIPSCNYCDNTARDTEKCYFQQKTQTQCSINHFISKLKCVKEFGKCKHKILSHDGFREVTTIEPTTIDSQEEISTPVTEFAKYGYDRDKGKPDRRRDHDCAPCDCSQSEKKAGVSVGVTVGLLFLGVVIGAIVTAVICICVPSLHRTSILGGKMRKGFKKSTSREDKYQAQENIDPSVTDNTLPVETTINYPVVPSAPAAPAASNQTRYHTLGGMSNNRDSHMYSGLQPESPEYFEPIGDSDKYQSPENQPMKGPKTVMSPVYQEFTDNVISSAGNNHSKHSANNDNQNSVSQNQPIRSTDTNADATNHNYFVLEPQNKANNSNLPANERPVSDHQYFVLEEQKGQQASDYSEIPSETDKNYHDYFVLEKEQKE
ncbi:uncharacterized protein LOC123528566 isoform X2 [Mercenaria mercenaria]|uniref:uncharacterized protein LOC123528566 isoform X2 n=1 Tax=Mercenaria mercenaria TaxID=6596 RepID=UPI00234E8595|nr:uncharacterized protein LOC123528566 isoform X2 [Mercenaria mercenaria]